MGLELPAAFVSTTFAVPVGLIEAEAEEAPTVAPVEFGVV
jgi:hypothetical protein